MKGYFYIYNSEDRWLPEQLAQKDWSHTVVLKEHVNCFNTFEEAENWKWIYNSGYISRRPWFVFYKCGLDWKGIEFVMHAREYDYVPDMMNWFIRRFCTILDVSREVVCGDKKEEFFRYVKDILQYKGDDELLKGIIMHVTDLEIRYW